MASVSMYNPVSGEAEQMIEQLMITANQLPPSWQRVQSFPLCIEFTNNRIQTGWILWQNW